MTSIVFDQGSSGTESWPVADYDDVLEVLADQAGADGVLTFTFTTDSTPWVRVDTGDPVRVTTTQTPTASFGIPVESGGAFPIPAKSISIKVYAATGQIVSVYGTR